jgi:hypothetical protein
VVVGESGEFGENLKKRQYRAELLTRVIIFCIIKTSKEGVETIKIIIPKGKYSCGI